jgi:hypothetical protein
MAGKKERAVIKTGPTSERKQRGRIGKLCKRRLHN